MTDFRDRSLEPYSKAFLVSAFCIIAVFGVLFFRLAYLQIWKGDKFRNLSENNRIRLLEIHASRGKILDANHEDLADNRPCFDVAAIPEDILDYPSLEKTLTALSPLPPETLKEKLRELKTAVPFRTRTLWKDATWEAMSILEANRLRVPGVLIQVNQVRNYLYGNLLAHTIGYMGEIGRKELKRNHTKDYRIGDRIGKVGIERTWEGYLRGKKGGVQVEVDARGRQIRVLEKMDPIPGKNVVLNINRKLQEAAKNAFGDKKGVALASDPRDGSILCYINLPSYDPNNFEGGIAPSEWKKLLADPYNPLMNRAIQGSYPPGSIFKIVVAMAALEEGVATPEEKIYCSGKYRLGESDFRCWKRYGHGSTNMNKAIVESCDVYFYQIGQRLGIQKINEYAKRFGLGKKTKIRLGSERTGLVPSREWKKKRFKKSWYPGETLHVSIGQGYLETTPVQILMLISATANNGELWRPRLVDRVEYTNGKVFFENQPQKTGSLNISSRTVGIVKKALRDVVHSSKGTGKKAQLPFTEIAGKTGTAQVVRQEENRQPDEEIPRENKDHAWFACYAPAAAPEIAVVVLVEHGGHGGEVAAPIAKKILEVFFQDKTTGKPSLDSLSLNKVE